MTDKELARTMRGHAEWADGNLWDVPITLSDDAFAAADAIERLTAEADARKKEIDRIKRAYEEPDNGYLELFMDYCKTTRERDAAVRDIYKLATGCLGICDICLNNPAEAAVTEGKDYCFRRCAECRDNDCPCRSCEWGDGWEWRGYVPRREDKPHEILR